MDFSPTRQFEMHSIKMPETMEKLYKNCQSCGMPLKRDEQKGGTNADGTKSIMYCSHCYQKGQYTQPKLSVDEMKELVRGKLKQFGFPGFMTGVFTRNIPTLKRWKNSRHL